MKVSTRNIALSPPLILNVFSNSAWCCLPKALPDLLPSHAHAAVGQFPEDQSINPSDPSHRNLVSSLLEHEQIKTTLPKAKETARLAEKVCQELKGSSL